MVCDYLRTSFGRDLHQDVLNDCPIFLIYELEKKDDKKLRYVVVMDPEVDFKDLNGDMKSAIIIHAVCVVSSNNAEVSWSKMRGIILQFLHNVIIKFNPIAIFLSGPFENGHWLAEIFLISICFFSKAMSAASFAKTLCRFR
jgi:hypothetical protein